jgi:transcriptional regulator with XRE-family HTH domain
VDDVRIGRVVRALRRRKGWRQLDLALAAGCSQTLISLIERGHIDELTLRTLRRVLAALEVRSIVDLSWRGAALDRMLDETHSGVVGTVAAHLRKLGWLVEIEVTYSEFGERGSIDVFAFHEATGTLLVIEVKTDLPSTEATLRKLDEKERLAPDIARKRFGWRARSVARIVVMPDTSTLRRRIARHSDVFDPSLPGRGNAIRSWLRAPSGPMSGLWFVSVCNGGAGRRAQIAPSRVRTRKGQSASTGIAA